MHAGRVGQDAESADLSAVSGTPTFFSNGQRHYGAYDAKTLIAAIEAARARVGLGARSVKFPSSSVTAVLDHDSELGEPAAYRLGLRTAPFRRTKYKAWRLPSAVSRTLVGNRACGSWS